MNVLRATIAALLDNGAITSLFLQVSFGVRSKNNNFSCVRWRLLGSVGIYSIRRRGLGPWDYNVYIMKWRERFVYLPWKPVFVNLGRDFTVAAQVKLNEVKMIIGWASKLSLCQLSQKRIAFPGMRFRWTLLGKLLTLQQWWTSLKKTVPVAAPAPIRAILASVLKKTRKNRSPTA